MNEEQLRKEANDFAKMMMLEQGPNIPLATVITALENAYIRGHEKAILEGRRRQDVEKQNAKPE